MNAGGCAPRTAVRICRIANINSVLGEEGEAVGEDPAIEAPREI